MPCCWRSTEAARDDIRNTAREPSVIFTLWTRPLRHCAIFSIWAGFPPLGGATSAVTKNSWALTASRKRDRVWLIASVLNSIVFDWSLPYHQIADRRRSVLAILDDGRPVQFAVDGSKADFQLARK